MTGTGGPPRAGEGQRHKPADQGAARPYAAAADVRDGSKPLPDRFRRQADALTRENRSPLSAALMYNAADDAEANGIVAKLFEPVPTPPGSVPQLRLLGALHHLVLDGQAQELAVFYPSAGGTRTPDAIWPAAAATIEAHFDWIQERLRRTVQTNEPGRSTVLYPALLWLTDRYQLPIRLLEIGASAGLNLLADRYCYVAQGQELGDAASPVRFTEPWQPGPPKHVSAAAGQLTITHRAGCDEHPLAPQDPADRKTLLSYIWPDETERFQRNQAALELAAAAPVRVDAAPAGEWLPDALAERRETELTVVWQSVFRQYVSADDWAAIEAAIRQAAEASPAARIAWLRMEPGEDHLAHMGLTFRELPQEGEQLLASCGDHGPPVVWAGPDR
jgi:hypothetical protein